MDIEQFIEKRPYLYHLTSKENAENIIKHRYIYSTNKLVEMSEDASHAGILRTRRIEHYEVVINGQSYYLRDQRPISELALSKCLTDNWQVGDFLYHLNDRVFMWPTLERLSRHYKRYQQEAPVIFRFPTAELLELNPHVLFCRLNSGATRANSYLGGKAPDRGPETFLPANLFDRPVRDVAEVTFENSCNININFKTGNTPDFNFDKEFPKV